MSGRQWTLGERVGVIMLVADPAQDIGNRGEFGMTIPNGEIVDRIGCSPRI
ncbi:hypothetical protein [Nocardia alni]|uniref:hypothetical protein n=1 Tax=Nocardia alni TaxID=2815723 RepID=UPI001C235F7C|nr:hypothetical protein [Nocardia alni]